MTRWLGWIGIGWMLLICAAALTMYGTEPSRQSLDARTRAVAVELRCLVCQGESVADSNSRFSQAIRRLIRDRLRQGQSMDQIKSYLVSRYGNSILLSPPSAGIGSLAWIGPPLLILGGLGLLATLVTDWRRKGRGPVHVARAEYIERVRAELAVDSTE
jgi:cytochrome c-type biogenesis protein CcmH